MSYHRFTSLRERFAGDLAGKLTEGVKSMDFMVRKCNCLDPSGKKKCQYGGMCRVPIVVYKITCKMTNKIYIGNTQQNFKKRMAGHFQDVKKLMEKGILSDSYARHFAGIWPRGQRCSITIARDANKPLVLRYSLERKSHFGSQNFRQVHLRSMQQRKDGNC